MANQYELDYLNLLRRCLQEGFAVDNDRTGIGTIQVTGQTLTAENVGVNFPTLTTRPTAFRIAFWETMMYLNGITDTKFLEEKEIHIWEGNTTREFLNKRGLINVPEKDMGKGYGFQWRNFGGEVVGDSRGVDQIREMLIGLETDPYGRRHLFTSWNPQQLAQMALPPCHILNQYMVVQPGTDPTNLRLDSTFYMRSCDMVFGLPFNMMGYAFLNIAFANYLSNTASWKKEGKIITPGKVTFMGGDCHIYKNQIDMVRTQLERDPYPAPYMKMAYPICSFQQLLNLSYMKDCRLKSFQRHERIADAPAMAV